MDFYCLLNGFQVKKLSSRSELKAAFDLKNRVNQAQSGLKAVPEADEFIYPKGLALILGVYRKGKLIGSIQLMDLTQIEPYTSKVYAKANLDYQPSTTYEVKSFVVDTPFQHGIGGVFNILVFYAIFFTEKTQRNKWLVVTSNVFYEKIKKRSGLPTTFISDEYQYIEDDTTQSRYCRNYGKEGILKDYSCYYIHIPKGLLIQLTFKFFRMSFQKTMQKIFKGLRFTFSFQGLRSMNLK
jgi:hypothetical protein